MHRSCEWISGCCKKDLVQPWLKLLKPSSSSCICWIPGIHRSSNSCRGLYWALMGSNCFLHCYLGKQSWKRIILYTTTVEFKSICQSHITEGTWCAEIWSLSHITKGYWWKVWTVTIKYGNSGPKFGFLPVNGKFSLQQWYTTMHLRPITIKMYCSTATTDKILTMSQLPKQGDKNKISSGVSQSWRGVNLIWILQYSWPWHGLSLSTRVRRWLWKRLWQNLSLQTLLQDSHLLQYHRSRLWVVWHFDLDLRLLGFRKYKKPVQCRCWRMIMNSILS